MKIQHGLNVREIIGLVLYLPFIDVYIKQFLHVSFSMFLYVTYI